MELNRVTRITGPNVFTCFTTLIIVRVIIAALRVSALGTVQPLTARDIGTVRVNYASIVSVLARGKRVGCVIVIHTLFVLAPLKPEICIIHFELVNLYVEKKEADQRAGLHDCTSSSIENAKSVMFLSIEEEKKLTFPSSHGDPFPAVYPSSQLPPSESVQYIPLLQISSR